jgi:hypothetical protein
VAVCGGMCGCENMVMKKRRLLKVRIVLAEGVRLGILMVCGGTWIE